MLRRVGPGGSLAGQEYSWSGAEGGQSRVTGTFQGPEAGQRWAGPSPSTQAGITPARSLGGWAGGRNKA